MQAPQFNLNKSSRNLRYNFFFYKVSEAEIFRERSRTLEEHLHKNSELGSQYFQRYDLWKLGLFQAPEFHLKEVIVGKFQ